MVVHRWEKEKLMNDTVYCFPIYIYLFIYILLWAGGLGEKTTREGSYFGFPPDSQESQAVAHG